MTRHSKWGFVTMECTNIATRTRTMTAATHLPGWRTGTALISSGRPVHSGASVVPGVVTLYFPSQLRILARPGTGTRSAGRPVDGRGRDGAGLHAPLLTD